MIQEVHRQVFVTVSVPSGWLWRFLEQFGNEFAIPSGDDLGRKFKTIRAAEYVADPRTPENMWVTVQLHPDEEQKFSSFYDSFPSTTEELYGKTPKRLDLSDAIAKGEEVPTCPSCGHVTVRNGACFKCLNCGESLGCS